MQVSVSADTEFGVPVSDTLMVSANRSWNAVVAPDCDWMRAETEGNLNVSGQRLDKTVVLNFDNNLVEQDRSTVLTFCCEGEKYELPVTQKAIVYRLKPYSPTDYPSVEYLGDYIVLRFNCNTDWTARVGEDSTADASIDVTSGSGNGKIAVTFAENKDYEEKTFSVIVSANGCDDLTFSFVQQSSRPYVLVDYEKSDTTLVQSIGAYRRLFFKSNVHWTSSFAGQISFDSFPAEGDSGEWEVRFHMDGNADFDKRASGSLMLTPEGGDPVEVRYTQEKGSVISLVFRLYPDEYINDMAFRNWPFSKNLVNNEQDCTYYTSFGAYPFTFHYEGTSGNICYNQIGLLLGNTSGGGYIDLPGLEGRRLAKVEIFVGNDSQTIYATVRHISDNSIVTGGEEAMFEKNNRYAKKLASVSIAQEVKDDPQCYHCWELQGTAAGESLRLVYTKQRMMLRWITLHYE